MSEFATLFDGFNARNLSIKQVASSFIIHPQFLEITRNCNSILLGPRGCGKTTLLKMLTVDAQIEFHRAFGQDMHTKIPFFAVYIPTDVQWKLEIENLRNRVNIKSPLIDILLRALINTNVYNSFLNTLSSLIGLISKELLNSKIIDFNLDLIKILKLPSETLPSIYSVEQQVNERRIHVNSIITQIQDGVCIDIAQLPRFYSEDFMDVLQSLSKSFEHFFGDDDNIIFKSIGKPFKWALCFDELELAPEVLQKKLIRYFRSRYQGFIFKLTSIPIIDIFEAGLDLPSAGNDYNAVNLWLYNNSQEKSWEIFSDQLVRLKVKTKFNLSVNPKEVFGPSNLSVYLKETTTDYILEQMGTEYSDEKKLLVLSMRELFKRDKSFRNYIQNKDGLSKNLLPTGRKQDSEIHRKISPIVIFRNYYLKEIGANKEIEVPKTLVKRTRKIKNPFNYGWENICKISDGNPRLLIGIIENLFLNTIKDQFRTRNTFSIDLQSEEIYAISKRTAEIWGTHPNSNMEAGADVLSLKKLIDHIGKFFSNQILKDDFNAGPFGTFIIDKNLNNKHLSLIRLGLFLGAFVLLNPADNLTVNSLTGKKFRLSFVLYPYYILPIRVESKSNRLSDILKTKVDNPDQGELFK